MSEDAYSVTIHGMQDASDYMWADAAVKQFRREILLGREVISDRYGTYRHPVVSGWTRGVTSTYQTPGGRIVVRLSREEADRG